MNNPDDYRRCAAAGLTMAETADRLGVAYDAALAASKAHGIRFKRAKMGRKPNTTALGLPPRQAIAVVLRRPMTTPELCRKIGMPGQLALYHLRLMVKMGLVRMCERIGRVVIWEPVK